MRSRVGTNFGANLSGIDRDRATPPRVSSHTILYTDTRCERGTSIRFRWRYMYTRHPEIGHWPKTCSAPNCGCVISKVSAVSVHCPGNGRTACNSLRPGIASLRRRALPAIGRHARSGSGGRRRRRGLKAHGISSSIRDCGWPSAIARASPSSRHRVDALSLHVATSEARRDQERPPSSEPGS